MRIELPLTREDVMSVMGRANFGDRDPFDTIKVATLKTACGYSSGSTVKSMMYKLGLTLKGKNELTKYGKNCLWVWHGRDEYKLEGLKNG